MVFLLLILTILFLGIVFAVGTRDPRFLGLALLVSVLVFVVGLLASALHVGALEKKQTVDLVSLGGIYASVSMENDSVFYFTEDGLQQGVLGQTRIFEGPAKVEIMKPRSSNWDFVHDTHYYIYAPRGTVEFSN